MRQIPAVPIEVPLPAEVAAELRKLPLAERYNTKTLERFLRQYNQLTDAPELGAELPKHAGGIRR